MKKIVTLLLAMMLAIGLVGCGSDDSTDDAADDTQTADEEAAEDEEEEPVQEEITIEHPLGETTVTTNPERVVVMDYGILDAMDYAGVDSVVALPNSGNVPEHLSKYEADEYIVVGNLVEADFEAINKADPDLIIITSRLTESYDELSEIAPTVFLTMPSTEYIETLEENLDILSQIFTAQADRFAEELEEIQERIDVIAEASADNTALLIQTNDDALSVFGLGSRYGSIYSTFGFSVTDDTIEASTHGQSATFEYVAEQNPDYLFVIDRSAAINTEGATGAEKLLENQLIEDMDAAKNDRIFYLDSTNWYTVAGGIQSTISMIEEIEEALGL